MAAETHGGILSIVSTRLVVLIPILALTHAGLQPLDKANIATLKHILFEEVRNRQVLEDKRPILHRQPLQQRGVYDCVVRFNFAGECWQKELRHRLGFFDNNPFVPIWVSTLLLEAHLYGGGISPSERQLHLALDYLNTTLDRSRSYENSLIGFYPYIRDENRQKYVMRKVFVEEIMYMFQSLPPALIAGFEYLLPDVLKQRHGMNQSLDGCLSEVSEEKVKDEVANSGFMLMQFHTISPVFPSDSDDTFSWLGLGAALNLASDHGIFTGPRDVWMAMNPNITSAFDALRVYAYRPFSEDSDSNTIDSRTYYALRRFLQQARDSGRDVALVTTWFQNIGEELSGQAGEMTMPTFVNDVCLAVGANVLYGITSTVLTGMVPADILDDPDILKLYQNTSSLIAHMIRHDFHNRQDLVLFYYPPRNQFYFFLSRSLFLLEMYRRDGSMARPVMETVYQTIKQSLEADVTSSLLHNAQREAHTGSVYFDDFIGDGDVGADGQAIRRGEDRIFSTSMAANTLIYTWSVFDRSTQTLLWKPNVPSSVVWTVEGCVRWLITHATDPNFKPWNAFFSSGRKGLNTLPFWYPANRFQFINGTRLSEEHNQLPKDMFFASMQGFVPAQQYEAMLNQIHFGRRTPSHFPGYNAPGWNSFAIWSSEAYSYASALLTLSLYDRLLLTPIEY
ncbi:hypothetical protein PoB_003414500 [Plakobranchus ocellatus]|uniref:Uncharacterized protein n=1 Tax=Plakobranchus ocellatus TaxID=259542 RepID=A0AAV4AJX6_9GAST|nr:hypothetical protein PoB_003414500 [Plakobranchus ocellatus]